MRYISYANAIYASLYVRVRYDMNSLSRPAGHIALFAYRIPQEYIADSGRNSYRCRAKGTTNATMKKPALRRAYVCFAADQYTKSVKRAVFSMATFLLSSETMRIFAWPIWISTLV